MKHSGAGPSVQLLFFLNKKGPGSNPGGGAIFNHLNKLMKHFELLKQGAIWVSMDHSVSAPLKNTRQAFALTQLLQEYGYGFPYANFLSLEACNLGQLTEIYVELVRELKRSYPSYNPIVYSEFPNIPDDRTWLGDFRNFWFTNGKHQPDPSTRPVFSETKEPVWLRLWDTEQVVAYYENLCYSEHALTPIQKEAVLEMIDLLDIDMPRVTFKETRAFLNTTAWKAGKLVPRKAGDILRTWLEVSNTTYVDAKKRTKRGKRTWKFVKPSKEMISQIKVALNRAYDLEESFKADRRLWLNALWFLQPGLSPELAELHEKAFMLRGNNDYYPGRSEKNLKTFNSKVTYLLEQKDPAVFDLLAKNRGLFMRSLKNLVDIFGNVAVDRWLATGPTRMQVAETFNNVHGFSSETGVVSFASTKSTTTANYAKKAWTKEACRDLQLRLWTYLENMPKLYEMKIFIDDMAYQSPLKGMNNRQGEAKRGQIIPIPADAKYFLFAVTWEKQADVDSSAWLVKGKTYKKFGWNGAHGGALKYSGDCRQGPGAEYLFGPVSALEEFDYIILECRVYSSSVSNTLVGLQTAMGVEFNTAPVSTFKKSNLSVAAPLSSQSGSCIVGAFVKGIGFVVLDVAGAESSVSTETELVKFLPLIDSMCIPEYVPGVIPERMSMGHYLELASHGRDNEQGFIIN